MNNHFYPHGESVETAGQDATFCPAVHGILIENSRVLLQRDPDSELWYPPGVRLEPGQRPVLALSAHFRALAQFSPDIGSLLFIEDQHQVDESGDIWRISHLYYLLKRPPRMVAILRDEIDGGQPSWVPMNELERQQMQFGYAAIQTAARRLRSQQ